MYNDRSGIQSILHFSFDCTKMFLYMDFVFIIIIIIIVIILVIIVNIIIIVLLIISY